MKPIGKTYLVKIRPQKFETVGGIFIPQTARQDQMIHYIGKIFAYGIGFTKEEKKDLIPLGSTVILDYRKIVAEDKIRLVFGDTTYYVYNPEHILAIIEDEDENQDV